MLSLFVDHIMEQFRYARLLFLTLCYNDHLSWTYAFDTAMEPMFWLVDRFAKRLGPILVFLVLLINAHVIAVAYVVGLPHYWEKNRALAAFLVAFGQWFFVNVVFHYYMAYTVGPGAPPERELLPQVATICKKCVSPKPPRTHHCSVCNQCVLKMDHHCPWLNRCVGHLNHRHFFLYMVYTVLGCLFLMVFGFEILWNDFFHDAAPPPADADKPNQINLFTRRSMIRFEAFITTSCFFVLGGLCVWHAKLITRGETSIEAHINRSEAKRLRKQGKVYRNPYDFGPWHNWYLFLGVIEGRGWWSVIFPSRHPPKGSGLEWDTVYSCDIKWNDRCFTEDMFKIA